MKKQFTCIVCPNGCEIEAEVENGQVLSGEVISSNGSGHSALAGLLAGQNVDVLICGGIGGGAQTALAQAGIRLYGGVSGKGLTAANGILFIMQFYCKAVLVKPM